MNTHEASTMIDTLRTKSVEALETLTTHRSEIEAEAAVLAHAVEAIGGDALQLAARRIRCSETTRAHGDDEREHFDERGILLLDAFRRGRTGRNDTRGKLAGDRLYLLSDGAFAIVERKGTWSHWEGEADHWTAELTRRRALEIARVYDLGAVLRAMLIAIDKPKDPAPMRARAEALRAIVKAV